MATKKKGKAPSRMELRRAAEAAEKKELAEGGEKTTKKSAKKTGEKKTGEKKTAAKKPKKSKKAAVVRLRMVWGVFDNSNQQVATFPYSEKAAAEKKLSDLLEKGRGNYFLQPVKEPIPVTEVEA